jgi:hypothetical protein
MFYIQWHSNIWGSRHISFKLSWAFVIRIIFLNYKYIFKKKSYVNNCKNEARGAPRAPALVMAVVILLVVMWLLSIIGSVTVVRSPVSRVCEREGVVTRRKENDDMKKKKLICSPRDAKSVSWAFLRFLVVIGSTCTVIQKKKSSSIVQKKVPGVRDAVSRLEPPTPAAAVAAAK